MSIKTIYGKPKVGKTTLALKDAPKGKTAVISADQGLIGIDTKGFEVIEDVSYKSLKKLITPAWMNRYERIVVDTATSLHGQLLMDSANSAGFAAARKQDYGTANNELSSLLRTLRNSKKEVIVLAQEKMILPNEDWMSEDDDEDEAVQVTVDLSPGAASALLQMSDVIGRLYIAHVDERPVRRLWLGPSASIMAGARSRTYQGKPPFLKSPSIGRLNQLLGWTR